MVLLFDVKQHFFFFAFRRSLVFLSSPEIVSYTHPFFRFFLSLGFDFGCEFVFWKVESSIFVDFFKLKVAMDELISTSYGVISRLTNVKNSWCRYIGQCEEFIAA